ncbi:MAG: bifunctional oligoribonuclease/PAP phosphatase NrnA [Acidobacteriales bacterium]|nr:bifunctional oligoribonuclease/PAP phosphatase NrnA [Terriglobales bacterium]
MLNEVLRHIHARKSFVLTSHARPDGDAVGSLLACREVLRMLGKDADAVLHDGVPRIYEQLPFASEVVRTDQISREYDAAVVLECDSVQRTRVEGLETQFLISIDHHLSGKPFAHVNWIDPSAVATAEMVYKLACAAGVKISPEVATCLYMAVLTDTGSFMFQGTNAHTFELARELVLAGADPVRCARSVYFAHSTAKMRLLGAALSNLHREGNIAWIWATTQQMEHAGANEEDCEGIVNYALSIKDVEVAVFFRETADGRWRASLRSKGEVDVAAVAEHFGGGGHECASGCSLPGPLSVTVARLLAQVRLEMSLQ